MTISRRVHSVNMPPHRWWKRKSFRSVSFDWRPPGGEDIGLAATLSINLGQLRSSLPLVMNHQCFVLMLNLHAWPSVFAMRAHHFRAWIHDPEAEAMSCSALWFDGTDVQKKAQAEIVPSLTYGVLHHQTKQTGFRGMPADTFVDWLREAFPQMDRFIETTVMLERGLAEARSRTHSALSS